MKLLDYTEFVKEDTSTNYMVYFPRDLFLKYCKTHDIGGHFEEVLNHDYINNDYLAVLKAVRCREFGLSLDYYVLTTSKHVIDLSDLEVDHRSATNPGEIYLFTNIESLNL